MGLDTAHADAELYELKVTALLRLGREDEAFLLHEERNLKMNAVLENPRYEILAQQIDTANNEREAARRAGLAVEQKPGHPASKEDLTLVEERFASLPPEYIKWIGRGDAMELQIEDGDEVEQYRFFSVEKALEKQAEMLGWIHLHDESWPEGAAEIQQIIQESGIDPKHMLPIVGADHTPDCFLLRLDGEDCGSVYLWGHEELASFEHVVDSVDKLFPWLEARAREGQTLVL